MSGDIAILLEFLGFSKGGMYFLKEHSGVAGCIFKNSKIYKEISGLDIRRRILYCLQVLE